MTFVYMLFHTSLYHMDTTQGSGNYSRRRLKMRKLFLATIAVSLMSISAFAIDGKIGKLNFAATGKVWVEILVPDEDPVTKAIAAEGDVLKALTAAALTAKSTNADISVYQGTVGEITGWQSIILK